VTLSKAAQELEDEFARYQEDMKLAKAPAWMPTPGTTVRAHVIAMSMRTTEYGTVPVLTYETPGGEVFTVWAFHSVLRERLAELKTDIGSDQYLTYVGTQTSKKRVDSEGKPQKYHDYYADNVENVGKSAGGKEAGFTFDDPKAQK